jgi:poly-gamma-glutamate capsule biosynthesis protein CapA/YwtB (metallophosphatase superfamily)
VAHPLTIAATGDSLMTMRVAPTRHPGLQALMELLRPADVRFTNLEGTLHEFRGTPQAVSGGTYVCGHPRCIDDLKAMGFNLYAAANNHMGDWGEGGLFATMETLDRAGVAYAGIGQHLQDARAPRYLETGAGRIALLATTSTFPPHSLAGEQRPDCRGRPGVNPLRFLETVNVDAAALAQLADLHRRLGLGATRDLRIRLGFERPDPPGIATYFDRRFRLGDPPGVRTEPHPADLAGNLTWIRDARRQADWVIVSVHAHEMRSGNREEPAEFVPIFCRQAVEAGADVVFGHGPHLLRGMEVYRGKPIFYSLGNYIFQNETVERQPADFYERLGLGSDATPADAFDARGARGGFAADPLYWESILPICRYQGDALEGVRLYPITLGHGLPRPQRGIPVRAAEPAGRAIIERVGRLSPAVRITWTGEGFGQVRW